MQLINALVVIFKDYVVKRFTNMFGNINGYLSLTVPEENNFRLAFLYGSKVILEPRYLAFDFAGSFKSLVVHIAFL